MSITRGTSVAEFARNPAQVPGACAIQIANYNFCWRPRHKKGGKLRPTPAMAAGIVDTLWNMDDLYDAVTEQETNRKRHESTTRLLKRMKHVTK